MIGASNGGKHIEAMRTGRMKRGYCQLKATGCTGFCEVLEDHHESYNPPRTIPCCHHCHHCAHFRPWQLTDRQKEFLLQVRHGPKMWLSLSRKPKVKAMMLRNYVAPGRRKAQLEVRKRVRKLARGERGLPRGERGRRP